MNRLIRLLLAPFGWLARLEREGRVVWSLLALDAVLLGACLFALNAWVFNRPLDAEDCSTIIIVALLCNGATLQYGLGIGRAWWWVPLKVLLGQALAAAILHYVFVSLGMNLSGPQVLKFFSWHLPLQLGLRYLYLLCRRTLPHAPLEPVRLTIGGLASFGLISGFVTNGSIGSGDSYWYSIMVGDFVTQWRAGVFPVFVGQSLYAFNGAIGPLRFAPYLQHLTGVIDLVTGRSLGFGALQNLAIVASVLAGGLSAYLCTVCFLPRRRWTALALSSLFVACPGVMALAYTGDLFMSVSALPFVPWIVYGAWRTLARHDASVVTWCALPLALVWYCHPPIALWLMLLVTVTQMVRLARGWREARLWREFALAAVVFGCGAGHAFVSVLSLQVPSLPVNREVLYESLQLAFPGCFLPVSSDGGALGDYQLGWGLWLALLLAAGVFVWRPNRAGGALLGMFLAMLALLMPIPGLIQVLWRSLPQAVVDVTFLWPMQRFYVIMAALGLVAGAAAWATFAERWPRWTAVAALSLLSAAVAWSHFEALRFIARGFTTRSNYAAASKQLEPCNVVLTRYSFNPFRKVPSYYSHGYIDPFLENRVLSPDGQSVLIDNFATVRPADAIPPIALLPGEESNDILELLPPIGLAPDIHYIFRVSLPSDLTKGSLIAGGETVHREYFLPNPVVGFTSYQPSRTFGLLPTNTDCFPIWTNHPHGEVVKIRYVFAQPTALHGAAFAQLRISSFQPAQLPVNVTSWTPYRATVANPTAGAWLETPRLFIPGYGALVNGQRVEPGRSPDGRVMVPLVAGENKVTVDYPGSRLLRGSYYLALLTALVSLLYAARRLIRLARAHPTAA